MCFRNFNSAPGAMIDAVSYEERRQGYDGENITQPDSAFASFSIASLDCFILRNDGGELPGANGCTLQGAWGGWFGFHRFHRWLQSFYPDGVMNGRGGL